MKEIDMSASNCMPEAQAQDQEPYALALYNAVQQMNETTAMLEDLYNIILGRPTTDIVQDPPADASLSPTVASVLQQGPSVIYERSAKELI
jgi:hypothetical protein